MIRKIDISDLKAGMSVCGVEKRGRRDALFFVNNILLRNDSDVRKFSNSVYAAIYINAPEYGSCAPEGAKSGAANRPGEGGAGHIRGGRIEAPFNVELARARDIRDEAEGLVKNFMNSIRLGREVEYEGVHETVGRMVGSIFRNTDALLSLIRLKSFDDYTFTHSVNVCVLSLALGRHIGLGEDDLSALGVGAILHDIGKMLVPEGLLNKRGALSAAEFEEMKRHAALGFEIVTKTGRIREDSKLVVLQHHEKYDGTGYQQGLSGRDIHEFARVVSVADVYDAMTSRRVYQEALRPEAALRKIFMMREKSFEVELVERLVRCVGIYPIGALVELNTGEVAVVKAQNPDHALQPVVFVALDKDKRMLKKPFEADLKESDRWVIASRDSHAYGFDAEGIMSRQLKS